MTPTAAASPGRQGVPLPPLSCLGRRPRDGGLSESPGPFLSPRSAPQSASRSLPRAHRPISPDSVQKGLETPRPPQPYRAWDPHSLATAVAVTQRSGGSPRKETPTPVKQLTFPQSAEAPPASASPPTLWVVRSRSRAGLWVSRRRQSCKERK